MVKSDYKVMAETFARHVICFTLGLVHAHSYFAVTLLNWHLMVYYFI